MLNMDWKNPNYSAIFRERLALLRTIREDPSCIPDFKAHYRENPADFINDWGVTFDPRNPEIGRPSLVPFVLFPKQREWIEWAVAHWKKQTPGLTEKSRDMGLSWLATALGCTLCLHYEGLAIGYGSRLTDYVDKIGTMKPLLPKARMFMENLPVEFRGGWDPSRDAPYMRLNFPETGSLIMGEGGDDIGRGDRATIYMIDEAAYLERAELVERSLSQTTNCRLDFSSVNGMNNVFARKRHEGKVDVFIFDWRDDPRKDDDWYRALSLDAEQFIERPDGTKIYGKGLDDVTIAQEVDRNYSASVTGILIPGIWAKAALDATKKLGIAPSGTKGLALDIADEGVDKNAVVGNHGIEVNYLEEWSGKGGDIFHTAERAFEICDELGLEGFRYDADGLGAGMRGDARIINEKRRLSKQKILRVQGFRGSDAVFEPEGIVDGTIGREGEPGRTNQDYFANRNAQACWSLRKRFQKTYRWVVEGIACSPDEIISINSKMPLAMKLIAEISQPTYGQNGVGKMLIKKQPEVSGVKMKSPNLFDALKIKFAMMEAPTLKITPDMISQVVRAGRGRRG